MCSRVAAPCPPHPWPLLPTCSRLPPPPPPPPPHTHTHTPPPPTPTPHPHPPTHTHHHHHHHQTHTHLQQLAHVCQVSAQLRGGGHEGCHALPQAVVGVEAACKQPQELPFSLNAFNQPHKLAGVVQQMWITLVGVARQNLMWIPLWSLPATGAPSRPLPPAPRLPALAATRTAPTCQPPAAPLLIGATGPTQAAAIQQPLSTVAQPSPAQPSTGPRPPQPPHQLNPPAPAPHPFSSVPLVPGRQARPAGPACGVTHTWPTCRAQTGRRRGQ